MKASVEILLQYVYAVLQDLMFTVKLLYLT